MAADLDELRQWHAKKAERHIQSAAIVKAATAGELHRKRAELRRQAEFHLNAVRVIDADPRQVDDAGLELGRLLNRIHGDHGQYIQQHGWQKAAADALAKLSTPGVKEPLVLGTPAEIASRRIGAASSVAASDPTKPNGGT